MISKILNQTIIQNRINFKSNKDYIEKMKNPIPYKPNTIKIITKIDKTNLKNITKIIRINIISSILMIIRRISTIMQ